MCGDSDYVLRVHVLEKLLGPRGSRIEDARGVPWLPNLRLRNPAHCFVTIIQDCARTNTTMIAVLGWKERVKPSWKFNIRPDKLNMFEDVSETIEFVYMNTFLFQTCP